MQNLLVLLAVLMACAAPDVNAQRIDPTVKALGATRKLTVKLSFNINMQNVTYPLCAPNGTNADVCTPTLASTSPSSASDQVIMTWALNETFPDATANATGIQFRACFTNSSTVGRAWRFDKKPILPSRARQCRFVVNKTPLPIGSGNGTYVWFLPDNMPEATYFIRAYTVCGKEDGFNVYCAWGESFAQRFTVQSWSSVPGWLIGATVPCMCVGPAIFVLYAAVKMLRKKKV